jgi:hypothetical protein
MNIEMPAYNQKKLVLIFVRVPVEFALPFGKLDVVLV